MNTDERRFYDLFRSDESPYTATEALDNARAIVKGHDRGLVCVWSDEDESWDGECEPPKFLLWGAVYRQSDMDNYGNPKRHAFPFSSLGMVGVNSMSDVYLLNCEADLMREALIELDSEDAEKAQVMSERATYAGTV
jgi:hypothetical protein